MSFFDNFSRGKRKKVAFIRHKLAENGEERYGPWEIERYGKELLNLPISEIRALAPKEIAQYLSKSLDKYYCPRI